MSIQQQHQGVFIQQLPIQLQQQQQIQIQNPIQQQLQQQNQQQQRNQQVQQQSTIQGQQLSNSKHQRSISDYSFAGGATSQKRIDIIPPPQIITFEKSPLKLQQNLDVSSVSQVIRYSPMYISERLNPQPLAQSQSPYKRNIFRLGQKSQDFTLSENQRNSGVQHQGGAYQQQVQGFQGSHSPVNLNLNQTSQSVNLNKSSLILGNKRSGSQDPGLTKIQELSKQIDILSKEYMEKGRHTELGLLEENENLQKSYLMKLQEIENLKRSMQELELVKKRKEDLDEKLNFYVRKQESSEKIISELQNQKEEFQKGKSLAEQEVKQLKMQLEYSNQIVKQHSKEISEQQGIVKQLQDEISNNLNKKVKNLENQNQILSKENQTQALGLKEKENENHNLRNLMQENFVQLNNAKIKMQQGCEEKIKIQVNQVYDKMKGQMEEQEIIFNHQIDNLKKEIDKKNQKLEETLNQNRFLIQNNSEQEQKIFQISDIANKVQDTKIEILALQNQLKNAFTKIAESENAKNKAIQEKKQIQNEIINLRNSFSENQEKYYQISQENQNYRQILDEINKDFEHNKALLQQLQGVHSQMLRFQDSLKEKEILVQSLQEKVSQVSNQNNQLEISNNELNLVIQSLEEKFIFMEKAQTQRNEETNRYFENTKKQIIEKEQAQFKHQIQSIEQEFSKQIELGNLRVQELEGKLRVLNQEKEVLFREISENVNLIQELQFQLEKERGEKQSINELGKEKVSSLERMVGENMKLVQQLELMDTRVQELLRQGQEQGDSLKQARQKIQEREQKVKDLEQQVLYLRNNLQNNNEGSNLEISSLKECIRLLEEEIKNKERDLIETGIQMEKIQNESKNWKMRLEEQENQSQVLRRDNQENKLKLEEAQKKLVVQERSLQMNKSSLKQKEQTVEQIVSDKSNILKEIENWKIKALKNEERVHEVETDIKGLFQENDRLNKIISELQRQVEENQNQEKNNYKIQELENKLTFYMNENEKLNRIILSRNSFNPNK